jgi:hypothetical protein
MERFFLYYNKWQAPLQPADGGFKVSPKQNE